MAVMAPVSGLSLAALARFSAGLPLPEAAAPPGRQSRLPDVVVFSSAPMRVLSDLASAGLRQLAALLPMIEQAVQEENPAPLGHLAKAASAAARQIGDGHEALLAEGPDRVTTSMQRQMAPQPGVPATTGAETKQVLRALARQIGAEVDLPKDGRASEPLRTVARQLGAADQSEPRAPAEPGTGPIQRWLSDAKHLLRSTSDALGRAEEQLRPLTTAEPQAQPINAQSTWILTEILAAQAQVALAYAAVSQARTAPRIAYAVASSRLSLDRLAGATTLLGMLLVLAVLWILGGLWSAAGGVVACCGAAAWVWRINRASRGVTLDARR